jgi:hypothetical protein
MTNYIPNTGTAPSDSANVSAVIPDLADVANIVTAFQGYHNNIAWYLNRKANLASPTFTGTVTVPTLSVTGSMNFANVIPTSNSTGIITVNNTSPTSPGTYTAVGRIFVQATRPNVAVSKAGDIWMW